MSLKHYSNGICCEAGHGDLVICTVETLQGKPALCIGDAGSKNPIGEVPVEEITDLPDYYIAIEIPTLEILQLYRSQLDAVEEMLKEKVHA